ncbi:hypothetical protein D3C87_2100800 [compost metagenome]
MVLKGVSIMSILPSRPRRPPRATWPPAYALGKPSADASAEALTTTVCISWAIAEPLAMSAAAKARGVSLYMSD